MSKVETMLRIDPFLQTIPYICMVYITPKHNLTLLLLFYFSRSWKMTSRLRLRPSKNRRSSGKSPAPGAHTYFRSNIPPKFVIRARRYTRKNAQVVTSLPQTSCNKSVHKLSTSCVRTACF